MKSDKDRLDGGIVRVHPVNLSGVLVGRVDLTQGFVSLTPIEMMDVWCNVTFIRHFLNKKLEFLIAKQAEGRESSSSITS